jgi:hypothetical protein
LSPVFLRLVGREYLPMAGAILTWVVVASAVGHADAVRLISAVILVRAARTATMLDTGTAMRRRHGSPAKVYRKSMRRAIRLEIASLAAAAILLAGIVAWLFGIGQDRLAEMTALVAIGLPVRHFAPAAGGRRRIGLFQSALAWSGVAMVGLTAAAGFGAWTMAIALGVREWIALAFVLFPALHPPADPEAKAAQTAVTWAEVAGITARRGRQRLTYRLGRIALGLLGPFGDALARTGRALGLHRRIERAAPRSIVLIALMAGGAAGLAFLLPFILEKPAVLLVSASLLRVAAAAANVLVWWSFGDAQDLSDDDEDDD